MTETAPGLHRFLRAWRKSRNLTLKTVAEAIGSAVSTVQGWEKGARAVDLKDLENLAKMYGVDPAALLYAPDKADDFARTVRAARLAKHMTAEDAEAWLQMGERLTGSQEKSA